MMKTLLVVLTFISALPVFGQDHSLKNMTLIPKGEFNMGKNSAGPSDWQPEHKVKIDSFYLDKYEVTNRQYYEFCQATKHAFPEFWGMKEFKSGLDFPDYPVVGVSWFEADAYAKWAGKQFADRGRMGICFQGWIDG